jgi:hypothetical protein
MDASIQRKNNMEPKCPICGGEMKLVPAGISKKTGKPYNSFYACKTWECKGTVNIPTEGIKEAPGGKFEATGGSRGIRSAQNYKTEQITRFQQSKESSMRLFAANRDAVQLTIAEMGQTVWKEEQIKESIERWVGYLLENVYMENESDYFVKYSKPF